MTCSSLRLDQEADQRKHAARQAQPLDEAFAQLAPLHPEQQLEQRVVAGAAVLPLLTGGHGSTGY